MKLGSLRYHFTGLVASSLLLGAVFAANTYFASERTRSIDIAKFEDRLAMPVEVDVVATGLWDVSRLAATKVMSKDARIGFIYSSNSLCQELPEYKDDLKALRVSAVERIELPVVLTKGAAHLGEAASINTTCLSPDRESDLVYSGSRELKRVLLEKGVKPQYLTLSGSLD